MSIQSRAVATVAAAAGVFAYASYAVRRFEDVDPESSDMPGTSLDIDGVRIHFVESGQGEAVVLIHGLGASTHSFRHTIPVLAQHFRVIALDLKGFGYSARPAEGDYSLTAHADLVGQVMDQIGVARATVLGHSMGGAVAMRLALRAPERVSRLVLVDSATDREMGAGATASKLLRPLMPLGALLFLHRRSLRRLLLSTAVHDPAHWTPETLDAHFYPTRMKGHLRALGALLAQRGRDEPLTPAQLHQPTLILWGEHDRWLPLSRGEELAGLIPNARLLPVPSAGHLPLEEQPEFCNRALVAFLRSPESAEARLRPDATTTLEAPA